MRRSSMLLAPLALLLALTLAACGNKGPLVRAVPADDVEEIDVEEVDAVEAVEEGDDVDAESGDLAPPADPVEDGDGVDVPPPADPGHG